MIIKISETYRIKRKKRKKVFLVFLLTVIGSIIYITGKNKRDTVMT
jgi:hypothetical protein